MQESIQVLYLQKLEWILQDLFYSKKATQENLLLLNLMFAFLFALVQRLHLEPSLICQQKLSCMTSFRRFIVRRSLPSEVFSDNGSNFKVVHDLKKLYQFLSSSSTKDFIHQYLFNHRSKWTFSPERAPQFGGLWEAAVKSAKLNLRRIIGQ